MKITSEMSMYANIINNIGVRTKEDDFSNMADGSHIEFGKQASMKIDRCLSRCLAFG